MKKLYSKDECAPDAKSASTWLEEHLQVKSLYFDVIFKSPVSYKIHSGDTDYTLFKYKDTFYLLEFSCGVYEEVYTPDTEQVEKLLEQLRTEFLS